MSSGRKPDQNLTGAFILIGLGLYFFFRQLGLVSFENWWALFILIPVFGAVGSAVQIWNKAGRLTYAGWTTLYGGAFPLAVALIFLFDLDWGLYWPIFVILGGLGVLMSSAPFAQTEGESVPESLLFHRGWPFFIGLGALVLGFGFLGLNLSWFETVPFIPFAQWWGVPILIAALGGLFTAGRLLLSRKSFWLVGLNLIFAFAAGMAGAIAIFELDWEMMSYVTPVVLIVAGFAILFRRPAEKTF